MNWQAHEEYNGFECNEYQAIAVTKFSSATSAVESNDIEDAGCDSCIHYNNGECIAFKSNSESEY